MLNIVPKLYLERANITPSKYEEARKTTIMAGLQSAEHKSERTTSRQPKFCRLTRKNPAQLCGA